MPRLGGWEAFLHPTGWTWSQMWFLRQSQKLNLKKNSGWFNATLFPFQIQVIYLKIYQGSYSPYKYLSLYIVAVIFITAKQQICSVFPIQVAEMPFSLVWLKYRALGEEVCWNAASWFVLYCICFCLTKEVLVLRGSCDEWRLLGGRLKGSTFRVQKLRIQKSLTGKEEAEMQRLPFARTVRVWRCEEEWKSSTTR